MATLRGTLTASPSYTVFGMEGQTDAAATRSAPGAQPRVIGHNNNLSIQTHGSERLMTCIYNRVLTGSEAQVLYQLARGSADIEYRTVR
jgi:hypothetical protein